MDRFTLTQINPLLHRTGNRTPMVRLTPEAYSLLATMAAESRQSMAQIAAQAVIYAHQHVAYEDEIAKED